MLRVCEARSGHGSQSIRILEVARIPTPERGLRRLHKNSSCALRLIHRCINLGFRRDIVPAGELGGTRAARGKSRIMGNARARPQRESNTGFEIEKDDCAMLELGADNALRIPPKSVPVEEE